MKYYYTHIIFFFILLTACGQTKQNSQQLLDSENTMNTVEIAYKNVKFFEDRVNYQATIYASDCAFELYVNDLPVFKHITGRGMSTTIPINTKILESGKQALKIKVFPRRSAEDEVAEKISSNAELELRIEAVKYRPDGIDRLGNAKTWLLSNQSIADNLQENKEDIELAVFEETFDAKVPYNLTGWKNSKNLSKKNKEKLYEQVLDFYKSFGAIMLKDKSKLLKLIAVKEEEVAQSLFFTEAQSKKQWEAYAETINNDSFKLEPFENFELFFYGDGKIVALESVDFAGHGESALKGRITIDGKDYIDAFPLLLHIPENGNTLQIIR